MMKFAILFVLVAAAAAGPISRLNPLSPTGRIVGGVTTTIDEAPYQVSLQLGKFHLCGASIISANWMLTAAHCMGFEIYLYTVRVGSTLSTHGGFTSSLRDVHIHELYHINKFNNPVNDIAALQLDRTLPLSPTIAPIGLYEAGQESTAGALAVITGWGALEDGDEYYPDVLHAVTIPIISKSDCNAAYSTDGGLPEGQICAALPEGGHDACHGDSGGPLAIDGLLAGIVSWGNGCGLVGFPGAYTEVAAFRDWITTITGV